MVSRRPEPLRRPMPILLVVSAALPPERTAREKERVAAESVISRARAARVAKVAR